MSYDGIRRLGEGNKKAGFLITNRSFDDEDFVFEGGWFYRINFTVVIHIKDVLSTTRMTSPSDLHFCIASRILTAVGVSTCCFLSFSGVIAISDFSSLRVVR